MCSRLAMLAMFALAGCTTAKTHIGDEDPGMGEAVKYNAALQTINPVPVYTAADAKPGASGVQGAAAVERYRTDKVIERHDSQAKTLSTTRSVSGGGGAGGGAGGGGSH